MTGPTTDPRTWTGTAVAGATGEPLGHVAAIYSDNLTGHPEWAAIVGGNGHSALVPLQGAHHDGNIVRVPFSAGQLQTAPHHDPAGQFSYEDGAQLYRHYGLTPAPPQAPAGVRVPPGAPAPGTPGPAASGTGPTESGAPAMTIWEERLRPATRTVVTGRLRLRKFAVTEEQTFTVPVTREEVSIDYEDVPDVEEAPGLATDPGVGLAEETYEVVRYEERVVITKELVPVERIRLAKRVVTSDQVVAGEVRREVVETTVDPLE